MSLIQRIFVTRIIHNKNEIQIYQSVPFVIQLNNLIRNYFNLYSRRSFKTASAIIVFEKLIDSDLKCTLCAPINETFGVIHMYVGLAPTPLENRHVL